MLPDDLGGWTRPERVSSVAAGDVRALAIAADGRGQAHVLWQARSNCNGARAISEIFLSTRTEDGRWLPIEKVDPISTSGSLGELQLVGDAAGNLYAEWQEPGPEGAMTYAAFRPAGGPWSGRWEVAQEQQD